MDNPKGTRKWNRQRAHQDLLMEHQINNSEKYLASLDAADGGKRAKSFNDLRNACLDAEAAVWAEEEETEG